MAQIGVSVQLSDRRFNVGEAGHYTVLARWLRGESNQSSQASQIEAGFAINVGGRPMVAMKEPSGAALAVGRLTGWEPLGFEAGDNNWYRFVANGPMGRTDPGGLTDKYTQLRDWLSGPTPPPCAEMIEMLDRVSRGGVPEAGAITVVELPDFAPSREYDQPDLMPWRGRNGEHSCIGQIIRVPPNPGCGRDGKSTVWGYQLNFSFVFVMGASLTYYHLWDSEGREAIVCGSSGRVGLQGDLSGSGVVSDGTLPEFVEGMSCDVSAGLMCGLGGSVGYNNTAGWAGAAGFGMGAGVSAGCGTSEVTWKNY